MSDANQILPVKEYELRSFAALLRRQIRVLVVSTLVIMGLAAAFLIVATPTYTATALILVDPDSQNILGKGGESPSSAGRDNARIDSEVEIIRSDAVAMAVIEAANLTVDPEFGLSISKLAKLARVIGIANAAPVDMQMATTKTLARLKDATSIRRKGLTHLISVSANSRSPAKAAQLSNDMTAAYIRHQVQTKIARSVAARDVLSAQIIAARMSLISYEAATDKLLEQHRAEMLSRGFAGELTDINDQIEAAEEMLRQKSKEATDLRVLVRGQDWTAFGQSQNDAKTAALVQTREKMIDSLASTDGPARKMTFEEEIAQIDQQLADHSSSMLLSISTQAQDLEQDITGMRVQMRRATLAADLSAEMVTDIYEIQQESNVARAQYEGLLTRLRDLETQSRIQIADSRVVSPALVPVTATFPDKGLVLLVALAASLGLGVSLAFLAEYYVGGITSPGQLGDLLQVPSVADLPIALVRDAKSKSVADLVTSAPLSIYAESVRKLKAMIEQRFRDRISVKNPNGLAGGRVILVTSAQENEGKTTTALSLARTFAQSGQKTLLIDADLRKPSLHAQLGIAPETGFLGYLQNAAGTKLDGSFYRRDGTSSLSLILGSSPSDVPTDQLLSSALFESLLHQAREVYEIVVIDSPPILPVVDARYIAHYADAVVFGVKYAATGQSDVKLAVQTLRDAMGPTAALIPTLTLDTDRSGRGATTYSDGYSAAI